MASPEPCRRLAQETGPPKECLDWPPPLPTLPPYPPCPPPPPPKQEVKIVNSQHQEWWDNYLTNILQNASGHKPKQTKSRFYELTKKQRKELLNIKIPTKEDKLIWSIPLPKGSYPPNGLPIWERLYLDHRLPMMKSPSDALVFARQQIGKKLWKDTKGQEFILYDPHNYEVAFSYENIHDPHLTSYYQGAAIRSFLLSLGDANEEGWGLCSLRRFNLYRRYLRRVHLSQVHHEMKKQEAMQEELYNVQKYMQTTRDTLDLIEKRATQEEATAALREAQRQYRLKWVDRILEAIKEKEERVERLYQKRFEEQKARQQRGIELFAKQELKNKIANEIERRKKIATLRKWHDNDERRMKWLKKRAEDRKSQKAEKVKMRWESKVTYLKKMYERDDEFLKLQTEIKRHNVEERNKYAEYLKKKEAEQLQALKKRSIEKKKQQERAKNDRKMEAAITKSWFKAISEKEYDTGIELYRIKKSINSTMAELLTQPMEGPDPISIIIMARNRIEREQTVPLQVSYAIDVILETTIEKWAKMRISCMLETVINGVKKEGHERLKEIRARCKDLGLATHGEFKSTQPVGTVYKPDVEEKPPVKKENRGSESESETTQREDEKKDEKRKATYDDISISSKELEMALTKGAVTVNYVHMGPVTKYDSPYDPLPPENLKPIKDRPKTPMPTHEQLCQAVFEEDELHEILPTITGDVMDLKEKRKFRKVFKETAVQLCKRINALTEYSYEPASRLRAVNKLAPLGCPPRETLVDTLCNLIMSKPEKAMFESEEFEWLVQVLARETVDEVLKPLMFQRQQDDSVYRTKIMFYKPKPKIKKI